MMSRFPSSRVLVGTALVLLLFATACGPQQERPNVVVIIVDTVRADAVGARVNDVPVTPHLDALADEGAVFRSAYAPGPWTGPTHASLFTGLYPRRHGAVHERFALDPALTTLAEHLRDAGYETTGFTCNPWLTWQNGYTQGFDTYEEVFREDTPDKGSALATSRATRWLVRREDGDRPFFLFVNYLDAHLPYEPPEEWIEKFGPFDGGHDDRVFTHEEHGRHMTGEEPLSDEQIERVTRLYHAGVAYVDEQVGRLLGFLRAQPRYEDTIVIATADHGEHLGEHGLFGHQFSLYDELVRVPMVVRYPPAVPPGTTRDDPISLVDVLPTVLSAAEIDPAVDPDGVDFFAGSVPAERVIRAEYARPRTLVSQVWQPAHPEVDLSRFDSAIASARSGRWKLIRWEDGTEQIFDTVTDPGERSPLPPKAAGSRLDALRRAVTGRDSDIMLSGPG